MISKWSNLLRALTGTCFFFFFNFRSNICSKVNYGSFLFASTSSTLRNYLNSLLSVFACSEVEYVCLFIEIRSRQLAGKFLPKHISNSHNSILISFLSLSTHWRYVSIVLPILAFTPCTITPFSSLFLLPPK